MEKRNLFSWNVLVGGYAKAGFFDEALDLYHRMLWVGVKPDVYTFPCVLRTCGGMPNLVRGREIHVHVIRYGFESDVDVVNALITMYVKSFGSKESTWHSDLRMMCYLMICGNDLMFDGLMMMMD